MDRIKIVIDTKGNDNGASVMIKGAAMALEKFPMLDVVLAGNEAEIAYELSSLGMPMDRVEILDAPLEITNYDNAAEALFKKTDSSMLKSLSALNARDDLHGFITAGNTGILLAGALRYLSGESRVRPALAAVLPTNS